MGLVQLPHVHKDWIPSHPESLYEVPASGRVAVHPRGSCKGSWMFMALLSHSSQFLEKASQHWRLGLKQLIVSQR